MRTIFIATDFSEAAQNAANYGVELAGALSARIVLFHAFEIPLSLPESYIPVQPDEIRKTAESFLLDEAVRLKKLSWQPIEIQVEEGKSATSILHHVHAYPNPMILVGRSGKNLAFRKRFGSTPTALAHQASCPVWVIPENASFQPLKRIALAAEIQPLTNLDCLTPMVELCRAFSTKLDVVRVLHTKAGIMEELTLRSSRLASVLAGIEWEYRFLRSSDVTDAINRFAEEEKADLLAAIPQHHAFLQRIFNTSESKKLIYHTSIPLLLLPESLRPTDSSSQKRQHQPA
jgi:nucleotide-binding universal stress UspA family protein